MMLRMKRIASLLLLLCLFSSAAFAQSGKLSFEVASIKPSEPMVPGRIRIGMQVDGGMLRYTNVSLMEVIRNAYRVKEFQIEGPEWLSSARFDITAKLPDGAKQDQVPEMLQSLLEERFKLAIHNDTKEHAIYGLVVGKNGAKLTPAKDVPPDTAVGAANSNSNAPAAGGGRVQMRTADVVASPNRPGAMMMMMGPNGMHMKTPGITLTALADALSRFAERPIVDQTGIEGRYDFEFDFMPEMANLRSMGPMPAGPGPRPAGDGQAAGAPSEPAPTIYEAVQQYGLKLEPRKAPMPVLVIDHIEKTPTEN